MYLGLSTSSFRAEWTAGNWWEPAVQHRALGSVLCDDLGGRRGETQGRLKRSGHIHDRCNTVQQTLTQQCQVITPQLKTKQNKKNQKLANIQLVSGASPAVFLSTILQ